MKMCLNSKWPWRTMFSMTTTQKGTSVSMFRCCNIPLLSPNFGVFRPRGSIQCGLVESSFCHAPASPHQCRSTLRTKAILSLNCFQTAQLKERTCGVIAVFVFKPSVAVSRDGLVESCACRHRGEPPPPLTPHHHMT